MSAAANPDRASSVILLKEAQPRGFEVLLLHRLDDGPVHGGMHRFPGGSIQKSDHTESILRRCRGLSGEKARKILGAHFAPPQALGFWIAALRVLFEEAGILFAVRESSEPVTLDAQRDARLSEKRAALADGCLSLSAILESENIFLDAASLAYFSHWQAPDEFARGFDTRFFLAAMPENPTPLATAVKVIHGPWLAPDRALQLFNRGELPMSFATFASLRTLADFGSVKSLLKEFRPEFT